MFHRRPAGSLYVPSSRDRRPRDIDLPQASRYGKGGCRDNSRLHPSTSQLVADWKHTRKDGTASQQTPIRDRAEAHHNRFVHDALETNHALHPVQHRPCGDHVAATVEAPRLLGVVCLLPTANTILDLRHTPSYTVKPAPTAGLACLLWHKVMEHVGVAQDAVFR